MMHRKLVLPFLFVIAVLAAVMPVPNAWGSTTPWLFTECGTIFHAKSLPDSSHVSLVLENIAKIRSNYIVVAEPFRAQDRLIVITVPSPELRLGQVINVEGDLTTLPSGERALCNATIWAYASSELGEIQYHPSLIKAFPDSAQQEWPWMIDLTVSDSVASTASVSESSASAAVEEPNSDLPEGPRYYSKVSDVIQNDTAQAQGVQTQSYYPGIPDVLGLPDGSLVELQCKPITAVGIETINGTDYNYLDVTENPPATDTIRAYYTKTALTTDRANKITGQIRHVGTTPVLCVDSGPGYDPQILVGGCQLVHEGTIVWARTFPDGSEVEISDKVVTADRSNLTDYCCYVEEQNRTAGVLVHYYGYDASAERDYTIDVTGTIGTLSSGERWIDAGETGVTDTWNYVPLNPLGVGNRAIGGGNFNVLTIGPDTPVSYGQNNVGLYLRTWGRVTGSYPSEKCFYIDDGSGLDDGNSHGVLGLKVSWDWQNLESWYRQIVSPPTGCYVAVTGISSLEDTPQSTIIRVLRPRWQEDISFFPTDTTPPNPGVASSPGYATSIPITVTYTGASDDYSGINCVYLYYKLGESGEWTYYDLSESGSTGSFSFTPTAECTYFFCLCAQDNAGNWSYYSSDEGDCSTIYDLAFLNPDTDPTGKVLEHIEYLYPGGPAMNRSVFGEDGGQFRHIINNYGNEGELLSVGGDADSVTYSYDSLYRVKTITDGKNNTTTYTYDDDGDANTYDPPLGHLVRVDYPGGDAVQITAYDAAGRALNVIDPDGTVIQYAYTDTEDLPTDVIYPATPGLNAHFGYDPVYGRLSQVQDGSGTRTFSYDNLDVPIVETTTYAGLPSKTMEYEFYPDGSLMTMTTPVGDFSYTYDAAGRPLGMTNPFSAAFSWGYLNNDWLQTQTTPVSATTYNFNTRGLLTSLVNRKTDQTLLSQFTVPSDITGYDAVADLLSMTANVPNVAPQFSGATSYSYSNLNQLASEQSTRNSSYNYPFLYDDAGNATTFEGATRAYNAKNQNTAFTYNANGNPTSYNGNTLTYDPENRLTAFGTAMTAGYTCDGLRAWKESANGRTYYLYSGWTPVCEMNSAGTITAANTFGPGGLLARNEGAQSTFYTFDPQGSVSQTLDSLGDITSTQLYDAYGSLLYGSASYPFGFGAKHAYYTDQETGLQLLTHRYYDSTEGRFLTRDPIAYSGGMNLYAYVNGNPVNAVDPSGFAPADTWPDYTARYWADKTKRAKDAVLKSNMGVLDATVVNSAMDIWNGMMSAPSAISHLGEGLGCWFGGDHSTEAACRAWEDVGTFSSTLLAVSAGPALRGVRGGPTAPETGKPTLLPDEAWQKNAPKQVAPGVNEIEHCKYNPKTGELERSVVEYDRFGRQVKRTDFTDHGYPKDHTVPHTHEYLYDGRYPNGVDMKKLGN